MPMELVLNATEPPVLQVSKGANFTVNGTVDVNVVQKNKTLTKAFTLGLVRRREALLNKHHFSRWCTLMYVCG